MKKKKIKVVVSIILLILIGTIGFIYIKNEYNKKINGTSISGYVLGNGIAPDLTPEEIQALLQKKVDASKLAFSVHSEPIFKGKKGTIMFANPKYSAHNIDLEVTVNNKVIIRTEKISPDQYIENIELGYDFQNSSEGYDQGTIRLVPCYMVYVSGIDKPYSVNAYTNEIIENAQ